MSGEVENRVLRDATAVEPVAPGHYSVSISEHYTVLGRPNGGYLQCVLANAALAGASDAGSAAQHVTAITTNFVTPPELGPADLMTEVRRVGRSVAFVHVRLMQGGLVTTESLGTIGTLAQDSPVRYQDAQAPRIAPLDECLHRTADAEIKLMEVVDFRLDPSCAGWLNGATSDRGEVCGWLRLDDGDASWDAWSLLFASDSLPPATFPLGSSGWVPTLQLTSYVRRVPVGEWLRARQWCVVVADGLVDERCELFDERGEMVASSSQLAMVRFPTGR